MLSQKETARLFLCFHFFIRLPKPGSFFSFASLLKLLDLWSLSGHLLPLCLMSHLLQLCQEVLRVLGDGLQAWHRVNQQRIPHEGEPEVEFLMR